MTSTGLGHAAALGCAFLWALSTVLFGNAARTVDARALNLLKCGLGALLFAVTALVVGELPHLSTRDAVALTVSAVLGIVVADTAYFVALQAIGAARGVLFVSLVPVCTALAAVPVLHEPLTLRMAAAMAVTLAGVSVVVTGRPRAAGSTGVSRAAPAATVRGVVAGAVYCTAQALANVLTKSADPSVSPLSLSFFRLSVGAVVIAAALLVTSKGRRDVRALAPVLPRGALATFAGAYVGLLIGTYALRTIPAGVATTLTATTPLFALGFARVLEKEPVNARMLAGTAVAVAGVALLVSA